MKEYTEIDLKLISKHTLLIARGGSKSVKVADYDLQFTQISHFQSDLYNIKFPSRKYEVYQ